MAVISKRLFSSTFLFIALMGIIGVMSVVLLQVSKRNIVPDVPGVNWASHHRALLIGYRPDCGCGIGATQWAEEAIFHHIDVIIVTTKSTKELDLLKQASLSTGVVIVTAASSSLLDQLSPSGKTTASTVVDRRIIRQSFGKFDYRLME